jgi:hypothetical protein
MRGTRLPKQLAVAALVAVWANGCGGCQDAPVEPPPPVKGVLPKPQEAPRRAIEPKEICAVLVFSNPESGPAPLAVHLTAEGDCTSGTARVQWDFGDGSPGATGETVIHTFEKPGTYKVIGKMTSDALPGIEDSDDIDVEVLAPRG